jgi:hypothetical protein
VSHEDEGEGKSPPHWIPLQQRKFVLLSSATMKRECSSPAENLYSVTEYSVTEYKRKREENQAEERMPIYFQSNGCKSDHSMGGLAKI